MKRLKGKLNSPRFGSLPTDSDCSVTIIATCPWGPRHFRVVFSSQPNCIYKNPSVRYHWDDFFVLAGVR
ncbi:unnamed protein product [Acanthoscelides obtectus]|uniref:Uncharacterized protein n=1 Tax=Acanthoscelides obtectus TaxID=200917 RepID=A0A9P0M825_ACAOB|nr:unnamed protein product [Acanthoscelides obtectus]CAK1619792.1 hypothetical protein AOBTE_LOCUS1 [Acanthoscelides obtectus]